MRNFIVSYVANNGTMIGDTCVKIDRITDTEEFLSSLKESIKKDSQLKNVFITSLTEIKLDE